MNAIASVALSTNRPRTVRSPRRRRAFSLIELLIVIGVILLLVAITVTVTVGLTERAETRNTSNTLRIIDTILTEWELDRSRQVTFGINDSSNPTVRYEIDQRVDDDHLWPNTPQGDRDAREEALIITDQLFERIMRTEAARSILATLPPEYVEEIEAGPDYPHIDVRSYRVLDAWGNSIIAVHPGREWGQNDEPIKDLDGTIRTPYEVRFGVAVNRRVFFVSPGPNGDFGNLNLSTALNDLTDAEQRAARRAEDNIYSYEILIEEARPQK